MKQAKEDWIHKQCKRRHAKMQSQQNSIQYSKYAEEDYKEKNYANS